MVDTPAESSPLTEAALRKAMRQMTPIQQEIVLLLEDNNGICHFERIKQHIVGRREPRTSIKSLHHRGLVLVSYETRDWGCQEIKYVRLTPAGQLMAELLRGA